MIELRVATDGTKKALANTDVTVGSEETCHLHREQSTQTMKRGKGSFGNRFPRLDAVHIVGIFIFGSFLFQMIESRNNCS